MSLHVLRHRMELKEKALAKNQPFTLVLWRIIPFREAFLSYISGTMRCFRDGFLRVFFSCLLVSGLLLAGGCTTFSHAWTRAARQAVPADSLLGCWEGTWLSDANGHNGSLRCVVTQKKDGTYNARFRAIYKKVLGFGYSVPLEATETNGVFQFSGQANLGWWAGGVYHYEGQAHGTNFFSNYRCKYDHGTFQMTRPSPLINPAKPRDQAVNHRTKAPAI